MESRMASWLNSKNEELGYRKMELNKNLKQKGKRSGNSICRKMMDYFQADRISQDGRGRDALATGLG